VRTVKRRESRARIVSVSPMSTRNSLLKKSLVRVNVVLEKVAWANHAVTMKQTEARTTIRSSVVSRLCE
jgi:hypothetical protein